MGAGEELSFQEIHDSFRPRIRRYLARLAGEYEAEDLTQEVFLKISQKLGTFRGESQLATWIYRIATNTALDRLRTPGFRQSACGSDLNVEDAEPDAGEPASVDEALIREEMNECIRGLIDRLPPDYRAVVALSELQELSNQEIADVLGVSLDAVKIRLHRARARLRKKFERSCDFYRDGRNELACEPKSDSNDPLNSG
jgi:RNA polymerase sigma-70 factor, ECF subfamily